MQQLPAGYDAIRKMNDHLVTRSPFIRLHDFMLTINFKTSKFEGASYVRFAINHATKTLMIIPCDGSLLDDFKIGKWSVGTISARELIKAVRTAGMRPDERYEMTVKDDHCIVQF